MKKRLYLNTILSFFYQCVAIINGLLIPRLVLNAFGSTVNGLVSSITQMLSVISFLDLGVGSIVQVALYGPLARKDKKQISFVYKSSKNYFDLIAKILLLYIVLLSFYFTFFKTTGFSWSYTISLILAISISTVTQYFFGITNTLLLNADQKNYIVLILNIFATILNALVTLICIHFNLSIQELKLLSSLVFILKPIFLTIYVKYNYKIDYKCIPPRDTLKNKWSGMIQHITTMLTNTIDYIVLTLFSTLDSISLYNIYVLPLNSIRLLLESSTVSFKSFFGTLISVNEQDKLSNEFNSFELIIHFLSVVIFGTIYKVLVPFVLVYTSGVQDMNYRNFTFSFFITTAYFLFSLRIIYTTLIFAVGHFKQTQFYCIIESVLNITTSIVLLKFFGITGVAIGTCLSTGYRLIATAIYTNKTILCRKNYQFLKLIITDIVSLIVVTIITADIKINYNSFGIWFIDSIFIFITSLFVSFFVFLISNYNLIKKIEKRRIK